MNEYVGSIVMLWWIELFDDDDRIVVIECGYRNSVSVELIVSVVYVLQLFRFVVFGVFSSSFVGGIVEKMCLKLLSFVGIMMIVVVIVMQISMFFMIVIIVGVCSFDVYVYVVRIVNVMISGRLLMNLVVLKLSVLIIILMLISCSVMYGIVVMMFVIVIVSVNIWLLQCVLMKLVVVMQLCCFVMFYSFGNMMNVNGQIRIVYGSVKKFIVLVLNMSVGIVMNVQVVQRLLLSRNYVMIVLKWCLLRFYLLR